MVLLNLGKLLPEVQGFFGGVGRGGSVTQPPFWGPRLRLPEFAQIGHMDL